MADNGRNVELTINSQEDMQGLSDEDFKNKMLKTLKSFKGKKIPNKTLKGDIEIRTSSIKKYKSFFADKNKRLIVPYIPELLEKAKFISENTYTPETEKNIVAYWKADLLISIDKDTYNVHLTVKEDDKGNFFWDAQVNEEARRTVSATNPSVGGLTSEISEDALNITPIKENVKLVYQNKPQPKGLYDANKGVIKIFENADFSTLPHELAHYWLDNMWRYVRSGNASEKYRQRWNVIANWLNVKQEQAFLTRGQQEKFARGYEQYLLNGNLPTPIIKGAFDDYDRWLKRVYGDMNRLNVRLSEDAVRFFQSMTTGVLPPQDTSDIIKQAADGLGQLPDVIVIADGGTLADRAFLIFFQKRNVHRRKQAVQIFPAGRRGGSAFGKTVAQLVKFDRKPVFVRKFANNVALARRIEKAFERIGIALPICAADFKQICRPVTRNRTAPLFDRGQMQHKFYFYAGFGGRVEN